MDSEPKRTSECEMKRRRLLTILGFVGVVIGVVVGTFINGTLDLAQTVGTSLQSIAQEVGKNTNWTLVVLSLLGIACGFLGLWRWLRGPLRLATSIGKSKTGEQNDAREGSAQSHKDRTNGKGDQDNKSPQLNTEESVKKQTPAEVFGEMKQSFNSLSDEIKFTIADIRTIKDISEDIKNKQKSLEEAFQKGFSIMSDVVFKTYNDIYRSIDVGSGDVSELSKISECIENDLNAIGIEILEPKVKDPFNDKSMQVVESVKKGMMNKDKTIYKVNKCGFANMESKVVLKKAEVIIYKKENT